MLNETGEKCRNHVVYLTLLLIGNLGLEPRQTRLIGDAGGSCTRIPKLVEWRANALLLKLQRQGRCSNRLS